MQTLIFLVLMSLFRLTPPIADETCAVQVWAVTTLTCASVQDCFLHDVKGATCACDHRADITNDFKNVPDENEASFTLAR